MNLRKYLKVYKKFLHTSLASELEYKTNILVEVVILRTTARKNM